jgi:hypothetical protein
LSAHEEVQEELTDQLAEMASQLRAQAEAQESALHAQGIALDSAAQGLLKSVHGVTAVTADTKTAVKRTRRSMFFFLFLLFVVSMVFLGPLLLPDVFVFLLPFGWMGVVPLWKQQSNALFCCVCRSRRCSFCSTSSFCCHRQSGRVLGDVV